MILLLITLILWTLKIFDVISWSYWIVFAPLLLESIFATSLLIKSEFVYFNDYVKVKKTKKEEE